MALEGSTPGDPKKFPEPIDIPNSRRRSASESDSSSESPLGPTTPSIPQSPGSSFLSYWLGQSPSGLSQSHPSPNKSPLFGNQNRTEPDPEDSDSDSQHAAKPPLFPFGRPFGASPFFPDTPETPELPAKKHARRASMSYGPPLAPQQSRGNSVFRKLSAGSMLPRPPGEFPTPPNTATTPTQGAFPPDSDPSHRLGVPEPPRRVPSPMGERILKGHFDGFN